MLDLRNVTDQKEFWKTVKPFLSDTITTFSNISLVEKGKIVSDESKVANSLNNFLKIPYLHSVSKQTNILRRIMN